MAADEHSEPAEVDEIGHAILRYLSDNPGSRDTIEGIAEWWLMEHHVRQQTAAVQRAVDRLVAAGLLDARRTGDGRSHYSLSREGRTGVVRFVRPDGEPADG